MENLLFLGVPILKHITVVNMYSVQIKVSGADSKLKAYTWIYKIIWHSCSFELVVQVG